MDRNRKGKKVCLRSLLLLFVVTFQSCFTKYFYSIFNNYYCIHLFIIKLLLSQNKYRKRLSNIPCYCKKCEVQVYIEDRFVVPDTNDKSGFTIKKIGFNPPHP